MNSAVELEFPWFMASVSAGEVRTQGDSQRSFGHRIDRPGDLRADGIFGEWSWDGHQLLARNDRYGIYPIYYAGDEDGIAISTSPLQLLAHGVSTELDESALAVLYWSGSFVGDDTPFQQIKLLSPDAVLRWRPGQLTLQQEAPRPPTTTNVGRDEAVATFDELFAQSIRRRLPTENETSVVPLSGGRDSRHILLELCKQGQAPSFCMTHGFTPSRQGDDLTVARQIVQVQGIDHLILTQPKPRLNLLSLYNTLVHFSSAVSAPFLIADMLGLWGRASVAYEGLGGDAIAQTSPRYDGLQEAFAQGRLSELPDLLFAQFGNDCLGQLLPPSVSRELARERLLPIMEEAMEATNPWMWFNFRQRGRRRYSPGHLVLAHGIPKVFAPFLDHDLVDFALSLPPSLHAGHRFHDRVISHAYPEFADTPFSSPGNIPSATTRYKRVAEIGAFTTRRNPKRLTSVARWVGRRLKGGRLCPPEHIVQHLIQVESLTRPGEAARQLAAVARLSRLVPDTSGRMLRPTDPLPV